MTVFPFSFTQKNISIQVWNNMRVRKSWWGGGWNNPLNVFYEAATSFFMIHSWPFSLFCLSLLLHPFPSALYSFAVLLPPFFTILTSVSGKDRPAGGVLSRPVHGTVHNPDLTSRPPLPTPPSPAPRTMPSPARSGPPRPPPISQPQAPPDSHTEQNASGLLPPALPKVFLPSSGSGITNRFKLDRWKSASCCTCLTTVICINGYTCVYGNSVHSL